jgi:hypothetical protein
MKNAIVLFYIALTATIFTGCATRQPSCATPGGSCEPAHVFAKEDIDQGDDNLKIPAFPYKPMIGTRNNDAKTVVYTGVVLKVYLATYKDTKKTLVGAHDRYVWAKEPDFIVGTEKPDIRKRTGMMTPAGKVPFVFGGGEIDTTSIQNNEKIKQYVDAVSESDKRDTAAFENLETADDRFDKAIKKYVDKTKRN